MLSDVCELISCLYNEFKVFFVYALVTLSAYACFQWLLIAHSPTAFIPEMYSVHDKALLVVNHKMYIFAMAMFSIGPIVFSKLLTEETTNRTVAFTSLGTALAFCAYFVNSF